jgi:hypothetical protein
MEENKAKQPWESTCEKSTTLSGDPEMEEGHVPLEKKSAKWVREHTLGAPFFGDLLFGCPQSP